MSAKREQFLKMIGQGWSVAAAARELGTTRSSANNWKNGYRLTRTDGTVVVFEALTPTPQPVSARFLSQEERLVIADELCTGTSLRGIATQLGRAPSTISREVRRNRGGLATYRPFTAEQLARQRRRRHHRLKVVADTESGSWVTARLAEYWSPAQIARALPAVFPGQRNRHLVHETIHRAVHRHQLPTLARTSRSCLRTGRTCCKAHRHPSRCRARFPLSVRMISDRPAHVLERLEPGHWEGDLIAGPGHRSNIATLVERTTRFTVLVPVPASRHAERLHHGLVAALAVLPPELHRSMTWDQGIEMSRHREVSADLGCPVFFCEKGKPWQRGSDENTNGLLRQYFPKGTDLSVHSPEHRQAVADQLNRRPRAVLGGRTPAELFEALLPCPEHPLLRP